MTINTSEKTHVEHLASRLGIPDHGKKGKFLKRMILKDIGFDSTSIAAVETPRDFVPWESGQQVVDEYILERISSGDIITMRFINDGGVQPGGYPVIYAGNPEDYAARILIDDHNEPVGWLAIDDRHVLNDDGLLIQTFSVKKSEERIVTGCENYDGLRKVTLGGGYRIQLDGISEEGDGFDFTAVTLFDDIGPRSTALNNTFDLSVPRVTTTFKALLDPEGLVIEETDQSPDALEKVLAKGNAGKIAYHVIQQLFARYSKPLSELFNSLLDMKSQGGIHSLEGFFSIHTGDDGTPHLRQVVTDFDGIDTYDYSTRDPLILPLEKVTKIKLENVRKKALEKTLTRGVTPYIIEYDNHEEVLPGDLDEEGRRAYECLNTLFIELREMDYNTFVSRQRGLQEFVKIGTLLRLAKGSEAVVNGKAIVNSKIHLPDSTFVKGAYFSIMGRDLGVALRNGTFISSSSELRRILGMPSVVEHYLREGD